MTTSDRFRPGVADPVLFGLAVFVGLYLLFMVLLFAVMILTWPTV